jgi:hypothetical protein
LLTTFITVQLRSREPLVDVRLFGQRAFLGDVLTLFATQFSMLAMTLFGSLYAQNLLGYSPVKSGLTSMAMIVPLMVAAQIAGRWYDKSGVRPPLLTGLALATVGTVAWVTVLPHLDYVSKIPGMALTGFGLGGVLTGQHRRTMSRSSVGTAAGLRNHPDRPPARRHPRRRCHRRGHPGSRAPAGKPRGSQVQRRSRDGARLLDRRRHVCHRSGG